MLFLVANYTGTAETVAGLYAGIVPNLLSWMALTLFFIIECLVFLYVAKNHGFGVMGATVLSFLAIALLFRFSLLMLILAAPALFLLAPLYLLVCEGNCIEVCLKELHLTKRNLLKNIGIGIAGAALTGVVVVALMLLLMFFGIADQHNVKERITSLPWYAVVIALTLAPLSEEIFFRGYLSERIGVILSSVLFALGHFMYGSIAEIIAAFVIGVLLCYIMRFDRSLVAPIVTHVIFNAVSLSLMFLF